LQAAPQRTIPGEGFGVYRTFRVTTLEVKWTDDKGGVILIAGRAVIVVVLGVVVVRELVEVVA